MKKIYSWIIDKWLAGFITASLFFMLKLYIDLPENSKQNFFNFQWFIEILNIRIPLYLVILIIVFLIIITRFEKWKLKLKYTLPKTTKEENPQYHYDYYKNDVFGRGKSKWSWDYKWKAYKQSFEITDLKPNCPNCGTPMDLEAGYSYQLADCHKCRLDGKNHSFQLKESIYDVEKEIIRKINDKEV